MEGRRHASTLARTVAELVVGGVSHLLVIIVAMRVIAPATSTLRLKVTSAGTFALRRVSRLASEVSTGL